MPIASHHRLGLSILCGLLYATYTDLGAQQAAQPDAVPAPAAIAEQDTPTPSGEPPVIQNEAVILLGGPPVDQLPKPVGPPPAVVSDSPATSVTLNLLKVMVAKKLLTAEEAQGLLEQAQAEADIAKAQLLEDAALTHAGQNEVRVTYIPENIKKEIKDDVRTEVMEKAREEKWVQIPDTPSDDIQWYGDVRMRFRGDLLNDMGNDNTGAFANFNAINTGMPFDTAGNNFSPQFNVDQDRYRYQLRARIGLEAALEEGWYIGGGIGTGDSATPVSQNQAIGTVSGGQGGNFSKMSLWLDRAYIRHEIGSELGNNLNFYIGRFMNPFMGTDMMWDDDLNFDGIVIKGRRQVGDVTLFGAMGAFPTFNSNFNFALNQPAKVQSTDKYLYAAQMGIEFAITEKVQLKLAAAYFDFDNIEGRSSTPFVPLTELDAGDTDESRPAFAQRGNTYFPIRRIIPTADNAMGTIKQFQYYGLATPFKDLDLNARLDIDIWEPYRLSFVANYVQNLAWDGDAIDRLAVNNRGPDPDGAGPLLGSYEGGNQAFLLRMEFGKTKLQNRGDWLAFVDYRYMESDAMPDAFVDNRFNGGGTNSEGFTLGTQLAISPRVRLAARWMSANSIAGSPLSTDIFMFDFLAKF